MRMFERELSRSLDPRPSFVLLHFSQMAWSRRGLPFGFVLVAARCRLAAPVTIWVHDPDRIPGHRLRHRFASMVKGVALRNVIRLCGSGVVSVPPASVYWARGRVMRRLFFAPSPSNIGERRRNAPEDAFTVTCFGIDVGSRTRGEGIVRVAERLVGDIPDLRVRLLGSVSDRSGSWAASQLRSMGVEVDEPGFLSPNELADRLAASHVFLSVREGLTPRSGAVAAALACELPVVGTVGSETTEPLTDAGILTSANRDWDGIAQHIKTLHSDPQLQLRLSRQSAKVASQSYTWAGLAMVLRGALDLSRERIGHTA